MWINKYNIHIKLKIEQVFVTIFVHDIYVLRIHIKLGIKYMT